jgi:hypothetical protein
MQPHLRMGFVFMSLCSFPSARALSLFVTMVYLYNCHYSGHYPPPCLLFETQLNSVGLSVSHRRHITSPLRAQQVNIFQISYIKHVNIAQRFFLEQCRATELLRPAARFIETDVLLSCLQGPATGFHPEPDKSTSHHFKL